MVALSFFASHFFLLPANVFLAAYLLFIRKEKWAALKVVFVSLGSVALMSLLKLYFRRIRPVHPVHEAAAGYSFPSGHSMSAVTFYGLIMYLFISRIKSPQWRACLYLLFSLLILAIGLSRIYLRVHYFSDVLGGYFFGLLWLIISVTIMNRLEKKYQHGIIV